MLNISLCCHVLKESSSSDFGKSRPISITPVLSKVSEKTVAGILSHLFGRQQSASFFSVFVPEKPGNM